MAHSPIDPDVRRIAKRFGVDPALIQAVVTAEGNILKAVQCSVNVKDREEALEVTCRSCAHALNDFVKAESAAQFIDFWAARWAPQGAANDLKGLNANWPRNVKRLWGVNEWHSKLDAGPDVPGGGAA